MIRKKCQTHPLFYPVENTTHIDITKHKVIEGALVCQSHLPRVKQLLQRVKIRRLVLPMWVTAPTAIWFSAKIASYLGVRICNTYPQNHPKDTTNCNSQKLLQQHRVILWEPGTDTSFFSSLRVFNFCFMFHRFSPNLLLAIAPWLCPVHTQRRKIICQQFL